MKQMTWLLCSRAESYTVHSLYPFSGTGILMGRPHLSCVTTSWSSVGLSLPPTITLQRHLLSYIFHSLFFSAASILRLATWTKNSTTARHATDGTTFLLRVCALLLFFPTLFSFVVVFFWFHHFQSHRIRSENNNNFLLDELILAFWYSRKQNKKEGDNMRARIRSSFSLFPAIIQMFLCLNGKRNLFTVKKKKKNFLVSKKKLKNTDGNNKRMDVASNERRWTKKPTGGWYVICHGLNPPSPAARPCLIF